MINDSAHNVPEYNVRTYCLLYRIEVGLREFVIEALSRTDGPRWIKTRLPGDLRDKCNEARMKERGIPWVQSVPLHDVYYLDFPDLAKVIEARNNWQDAFEQVFQRREITTELRRIEPIRNKIAHNRKSTIEDYNIVRSVYDQLSNSLTAKRLDALVERCTHAQAIRDKLIALQREADQAFTACSNADRLAELANWQSLRREWWFDNEYLGRDLSGIEALFELFGEYAKMPRERGDGVKVLRWMKTVDLEGYYNELGFTMDELLGDVDHV